MAITFRDTKGTRLTSVEGDTNIRELLSGQHLQIPLGATHGLKIGPTRTFGWVDLPCLMYVPDYSEPNAPTLVTYKGGIRQNAFEPNDEVQLSAHFNHDYALGTDTFIHAHWSHNNEFVTGGSVTWGFELMYAKGHQQMAFTDSIVIVEQQTVTVGRWMHMICEGPASIAGGSANLLNTAMLEVDGLIQGRAYLVANNLTVSQGLVPPVFLHYVDIHHQSTGAPTLNRAPNFYGV